jgi:hypothetical protein
MVELRLPSIKGATEAEQLREIKNFLYQHVEQLQWALNAVEGSRVQAAQVKPVIQPVAYSPPPSLALVDDDDAEAKFAEIKPLIIKSAEIVEAYYEEINKKLVGEYVAESDFGTYVEQTEQTLSQTSTGIGQNYTNIQKIITDIANLNFTLAEVNAHIKSGLLDYDENGLPIYGLEVGQRNVVDGAEVFNKYARFTAGRLSFYDQNGTEVAYVSDYKLYITSAEVKGTLKLGGYSIDTSSGLAFKWVGRG